MKIQFFFHFLLLLLYMTSCNSRGQGNSNTQKEYSEIINYINTKSITTYFNKTKKEIIVGSSFDSTNTLGIFQIVYYENDIDVTKLYKDNNSIHEKKNIFNKHRKKVFFFDKKHTYKVPMRHIEGLAVGWEYDIKTPSTVFIFNIEDEVWSFVKSVQINSIEEYYNIRNSKKPIFIDNVLSNSQTNLIGNYSLFQEKGMLDEFGAMTIGYDIKITNDSCFFYGHGYKTYFNDFCNTKQNADTLELYYHSTIEGNDYNKVYDQPILKLYQKGNDYYAKSPVISVDGEGNVEVKLKKE